MKLGRPTYHGTDVFSLRTGKVRSEWLSACKEERALTCGILDSICELSNLTAAMRQVEKNRGASGVDGMKTTELRHWFTNNYAKLQATLHEGSYTPMPVRKVEIPKPRGGIRQIGIPTVKDRLVQQAIYQVLNRHYDQSFSDSSYGFRPKRSAHGALNKAGKYVKEGYRYVVDLDLENYFDTVNHDRLLWMLGTRIGDKRLITLIGKILRSGIMTDGLINQRISGTPQGSPLSPLLSNIILDELDKELERRGHRFVRYADDMIILVRSEKSAERVQTSIIRYLEGKMCLKVNRDKSKTCFSHQTNYLGHTLRWDGALGISTESEKRLKDKLRHITRRNRGISLEQLLSETNNKLRGWLYYFRYALMRKRLKRIESWLRHRIRCFRLKQCKRAKGITKFLVNLNVPKWRAIRLAVSHKGWYRKAGSPQANEGMNIDWFKKIGLFGLVENYNCLKLKETAVYESTYGGVRGQ